MARKSSICYPCLKLRTGYSGHLHMVVNGKFLLRVYYVSGVKLGESSNVLLHNLILIIPNYSSISSNAIMFTEGLLFAGKGPIHLDVLLHLKNKILSGRSVLRT